ncbi:MAG: hypothetical protein EOP58_15350, partial [Sphingomonadales bacterium]
MPTIIPAIERPSGSPTVNGEISLIDSLVIPVGAVYYSAGSNIRLFWSNHNYIARFENAGTIWNASTANVSAAVTGFYIGDFYNSGTIAGVTDSGNAYGFSVLGDGSSVENSGRIFALTGNGNATAVELWSSASPFLNTGTIAAQATNGTMHGVGGAVAIAGYNGLALRNGASGRILAEGLSATAIIMGHGGSGSNAAEVYNQGLIEARSLTDAQSVGIHMGHLANAPARVINEGTIRADIAVMFEEQTDDPYSAGGGVLLNLAGGLIVGAVQGDTGPDVFTNLGTLTGNVRLGEGADFFDTAAGTWNGYGDLGWGDDLFLGSAQADVVRGDRGDDILRGNGGNDL